MDKPYPRFCGNCGKESVEPSKIDSYDDKFKYNGKLYEHTVIDLPIDQCKNCGTQWFTLTTDDALQAAFQAHLRENEGK